MLRHGMLLALLLQVTIHSVTTEKQQLKLSDSYLPVAMQVISHLTDQMSYEAKDDMTIRPNTKPTTRPTKIDIATQSGKLDINAIPGSSNPSYNVLEKSRSPSLELQQKSNSLKNKEHLLGTNYLRDYPHVKLDKNSEIQRYSSQNLNSNEVFIADDEDVKNLQRLSQNVRDFIGLASEPSYNKFGDAWDEIKAGANLPKLITSDSKNKLEEFNDLLKQETTKDNLSQFNGYSGKIIKELAESWKGGARAQLRFALAKLMESHQWHNKIASYKARALLEELSSTSSALSSDISRLKPLVYTM